MTKKFGPDVHPAYQPFMDWHALKDDPNWDMAFAIIKCSEGSSYEVRRYREYIKAVEDAGLYSGSYHYFYASDADNKWESERQAEYYVKLAGDTDLPLIVDLEDKNSRTFSSVKDKNAIAIADGAVWCLEKIEQLTGRTPMLYTGDWYMDLIPKRQELLRFPLWVASYQYPDKVYPGFLPVMPDDWVLHLTDWAIHQFSTKYINLKVAKAGYEWPALSGNYYKQGFGFVPVNCDINRTTEEKLNKLLGIEDTPEPPHEAVDPEVLPVTETRNEVLEEAIEALVQLKK